MTPTDLDKRASKRFQSLARESAFRSVTCRFRKVTNTDDGIEHTFWLEGSDEFRKHFGNAPDYFAGALEHIRLATGWEYPYPGLLVMVLKRRVKKRTSNGFALYPPGLSNSNDGEIRILWANGEFTITVLHELVHLFKKGYSEEWVEQQALKLTMEV